MQRQKFRVTLSDDRVLDVNITNKCEVAFEREAHMRKWPKDAEHLALTFKAWWALVKVEKRLDCTYEDFEQTLCDEVAPYVSEEQVLTNVPPSEREAALVQLRKDGLLVPDEDVTVDPTRPAPQPEGALT